MKRRISAVLALLALCALAGAQLTGIRVRAGYGWSGSIRDNLDNRRSLQGPEFGVDLPLSRLPLVEISLTGDVLLGGQLSRGADLDGTIWRLLVSARMQVPGSKLGVFGGVGWAFAQARGANEFDSFSGAVTQLGLAIPLGVKTPVMQPELQLAATLAGRTGLGGFSISLGIRF